MLQVDLMSKSKTEERDTNWTKSPLLSFIRIGEAKTLAVDAP